MLLNYTIIIISYDSELKFLADIQNGIFIVEGDGFMRGRKTIFYSAIIIFLIVVIIIKCIPEDKGSVVEKSFPLNVHEEWWLSDGDKKIEGSNDVKYDELSVGDVIYKKMEYKLTIDEIYENCVVLRQEGGLVPANENGSLNAFVAAEETYTVKKGETLKLRSYSLQTGIRVYISAE